MSLKVNLLYAFCCLASIYCSNGCTIEGVAIWQLPIEITIEDYYEGIVLQRGISNILDYSVISYEELNGGPYMDISIDNSEFIIRTNDAYRLYEENETHDEIHLTFTFSCTGGTTSLPLNVRIYINDNNNNEPLFKTAITPGSPDTAYEFTIVPPVPPGFLITNCVSDIIVRDIDLTNYRIDFGIEENPYVEIAYDEAASTVAKEYKALLRTTSLIRSLPEPIVLTISATDVDRTGDPPITTYTHVTIYGSSEFELPAEPVFSQAYYTAHYDNDQVSLEQPISLRQGYDSEVRFNLEGEYANSFDFVDNDNQVSLSVVTPLPSDVLRQGLTYLVVNAERPDTSGASATIIVQFPEAVNLEFERPLYEGQIVDNTLQLSQLILSQGYQESVITATVEDYPSFFTASVVGNVITLSMTPLDEAIIEENNVINLRVTASSDYSSATTIVTLEVIKEDTTTPVFEKPLYAGTYDSSTGLTLEPLILVLGYDDTVQVTFTGEHEAYFVLDRAGPSSSLRVVDAGLPSHIFRERTILLSVAASKPLTVGATTVVSIALPEALNLEFERPLYQGQIVDNTLQVSPLTLSQGYQESTITATVEDYPSFFTASVVGNIITLSMTPLDEAIIEENNVINLRVTASSDYSSATTIVTLEVVKEDTTTPVFEKPLYAGTYDSSAGLTLEPLILVLGYDDTVQVTFSGEHEAYFVLDRAGPSSSLRVVDAGLPSHIFSERTILLSVAASKPLTVGATTVVSIALPEAVNLEFERPHYEGQIVDNTLQLTQLTLSQGYQDSTITATVEDYPSFFTASVVGNVITLSMTPLDEAIIEENNVINLRVTASSDFSSATTIVTLEVVKEDTTTPVFEKPLYAGTYDSSAGLTLEPLILVLGYDDTVLVTFTGEHEAYFVLDRAGPSSSLRVVDAGLPSHIFRERTILLSVAASKPLTVGATTVVSIALPEAVNLEFERPLYQGQIVDNTLQVSQLTLSQGYQESIITATVEDYPSFFTASVVGNVITLSMTPLDEAIIEENNVINLRVTASSDFSSATTIVTLEVVKEDTNTPVFEKPLYAGTYDSSAGLTLEPLILVLGYDDTVQVSFTGEHEAYFVLDRAGPSSSLRVVDAGLPSHIFRERTILLSVAASKPLTVGAATVVSIALPEAVNLEFERPHYEGQIVDNTLQMTSLTLSQGYQESTITATVEDYPAFFTASVVGNVITLSMTPLDEAIIEENNVINLRVIASSDYSSATTIVTLEIVKEDIATPLFEKPLYAGTYDSSAGLTLEPLILVLGYDDTVEVTFSGEHEAYFVLDRAGPSSSLRVVDAGLPSHIFRERTILLSVAASKPLTVGATTVVSIALPEAVNLEFERPHYEGQIVDNTLQLTQLTLRQGYQESTITATVEDYPAFFTASVVGNVITLSMTPLDAAIIEENNVINLRVTASSDYSSATTIVTLVIVKEDIATPLFEKPLYAGTYDSSAGLTLEPLILVLGYDDTVEVTFTGEHEAYFVLDRAGPSSSLRVVDAGLPSHIFRERTILLSVAASKPLTVGATTVVSIALPEARVLQFEAPTYSGSIQDNILTLETIVLNVGFDEDVIFSFDGDYSSIFSISNVQNQVTLHLSEQLPQEVIAGHKFITLSVVATGVNALPTTTVVILEIIKEDDTTPLFSQSIYYGNYLGPANIEIGNINLVQGYDSSVSFRIEGENSEYFDITHGPENNIVLSVHSSIPEEVIFSEKVFVFSIFADKPSTVRANAAIFIKFPTELTEPTQLQFSKNTYAGSVENNILSVETIVLDRGYAEGTDFYLSGDYASSFAVTSTNNVISLSLVDELPSEVLGNYKFILLELGASRERAVSVSASIIIDLVDGDITSIPVFNQAFYTGVYTAENNLYFQDPITLLQGLDETVTFDLVGDASTWFGLVNVGDSVYVVSLTNVPQEVLDSYNQLLFTVVANKPNSIRGEAAISISLPKDVLEREVLRFAQSSYEGQINGSELEVPTIILTNEITNNLQFEIRGDHAAYFTISYDLNTVRIELLNDLPAEVLTENEFLVLDIIVSKLDAVSGYTTLILSIVKEEPIAPVFEQGYYTGEYSNENGLAFEHTIRLIQGFDESVTFDLQGESSKWFYLTQNENNLLLSVVEGGIQEIENINHLIFSILANKPGSIAGETTIIIQLTDYTDAAFLGFERANYLGIIENGVSALEPIILNEGYTPAVTFSLHGDLASFFIVTQQDAAVNVILQNPIPVESIPANGIVLLELRATAPQTVSAVATIVFHIIQEEDAALEELVFSAPYYTGQFSEAGGLVFETAMSLDEGYDANVQFALEGDHAQWFALVVEGNSVWLSTTGAIPPAILANNQQLVFVVTAQKPNSNTARATVVISLEDDYTDAAFLGFERANYLGTIENGVSALEPIILNEGYTPAVTFSLHGDLASFFIVTQQDAAVNVILQNPIPVESIPANDIVLLELRATAPQTVSAVATIVFHIIQEEDAALEELVFSAPYYTGQFSEAGGLVFETAMSLDKGYDANVQFALEGDHAQWFALVVEGSSVWLSTTGAIPPAILANNQQLVFVVTAQKPNSNTARATVVISLEDDYTDAAFLGFERANYLGTIENGVSALEPIILNEGYTPAVTFSLHGDLASYFIVTQQDAAVNVILQSPIPVESIPANGIVLLELRATAPQTVSAVATIVFHIIQEEDAALEELVFSAPYYTGQFSEAGGLVFETAMSLDEGYDANVQFALEGDHAQWFALVVEGNSVWLSTTGAIPPAILANNQQLVFVVTAQKPNSNTARATVVISLEDDYTDAAFLGFERASYLGTIENGVSAIDPIILNEGYSPAVTFSLHGDLASYFIVTQQDAAVNVILQNPIPVESIPANSIVLLELRATAPQTVSAVATIVFHIIQEEDAALEELVFSAPYYTGQFSEAGGLVFETAMSLDEGYDANVQFALEGDHAQWFALVVEGNSVWLSTTGAIPPAILANNQQLVFVVTAQKPNSNTARATVVISLEDDYTDAAFLGFERANYLGTIENGVSALEPIILNEGYTPAVTFSLHGDLASYFIVTQQDAAVNVILQNPIPVESIPANGIVLLELRATAPQTVSAVATIVFHIIQEEDAALEELVFSAPYYTGQFSEAGGLVFETAMSLDEGYDANVQFALEGDHAQWFALVVQGNSVWLSTTGAIPPAILANNQQLVFVVTAQKPNSNTARATVVISLEDDYTDAAFLGFERANYLGTIENGVSALEPIILNEGYTPAVTFSLHGDLASYFIVTQQDAAVNVILQNPIPVESIPANSIVLLELRATAPQTVSAVATIVFHIIQEEDAALEELVFSAPYYTGQFSEAGGLVFETAMSLDEGYDANVQFALEGDHAQWFALVVQGNSVWLSTTGAIPPAILANNQQLVFVVTAQKPNSNTARATVVISLEDDYTDAAFLGFERANYLGTIENGVSALEPIILNEGYTPAVTFSLHGDLASYFIVTQQDAAVNVILQNPIPVESIPANGIVLLELRATAPQTVSAVATIVFHIIQEEDAALEELVFSAPYYTGQFSEAGGLVFETAMSLDEGYDANVQFALEGDHAQWFALVVQGNSVWLSTTGAIPPAILANNQQLVFVVTAQKPNSNTARATVVISLEDDYTDAAFLGFERANYLGTIENGVSALEPIILNEGYTPAVTFSLHGDLASYFIVTQQDAAVNVILQNPIPVESIPANGIVLLELRATAPQTVSAVATIVFHIIQEEDAALEELVFSAPYYTGQFSEAGGLVFETAMSLDEGYDANVQFALEGDHAQWFALVVQGNSVWLSTTGAIPPAILANNQQLVFVVTAQKPNSNTARATVVISLEDDYTDAAFLGFERANYLGTIENGVSALEPIILNEGYTPAVTFSLHGDLASFFIVTQQDAAVNVILQNPIPVESIPANGIVLLELRATAPQTVSAVATIVFHIIQEEDAALEELVFSAPYYTGQFSEAGGLVFETAMSLDEGYDANVQFALEGDHAQWFALVVEGNSVWLSTTGAIPPAILANNQQLVFVVTAQKPNSNTARATVVISLEDDYTDAAFLGFERASYLGTIENGVSAIDPIILNEGYSPAVTFSLHGDLASYFIVTQQDAAVNVILQNPIPVESIPANSIVLLELRATAPQTVSAVATIVFHIIQEEDAALEELVFSAPYYTGQFSEAGGLVFETAMSLDEGYDANVQFALEGDHAQWFALVVEGNSVWLSTTGAIPPAILANNQQLVFVVTAQKPNSNTARATVVISLEDDYTDAAFLGFERASYLGTIENGVSAIDPIILNEGYSPAVTFSLHGDLASYFIVTQQDAAVNVIMQSPIPVESIPANGIVLLELRATAPQTVSAVATIVFHIIQEEDAALEELVFSAPYYTGQFSEAGGLVFETAMSLDEGYDANVQFALEGEHAQWFALVVEGNSVWLSTTGAIPPAILANNQQLVFVVTAQKPNSNTARATVVISLEDDYTDAAFLGFERASYLGTIENGVSAIDPIILNEGYTPAVTFSLHGDLASFFIVTQQDTAVNVILQNPIPVESIPANGIVLLELRATAPQTVSAVATIVFHIIQEEDAPMQDLVFSAPYYTGQLSETGGLVFETAISLDEGYDEDVHFVLEGAFAQWFGLSVNGNSVTLEVTESIPPSLLSDTDQLIFFVTASKPNSINAQTVIIISVTKETGTEPDVAFGKVLYEGTISHNEVQHEAIIVTGFTGNAVDIVGVYGHLFSSTVAGGAVVVVAADPLGLPDGVTYVPLELRAGGASAVLLLDVLQSETPELPSVIFGSPSYALRAEMSQTGVIGHVSAVASNGEPITYSLAVNNAHLLERVSVNDAGEIRLSAPTNTGVYSFQVIATSIITEVQATASVQLTVDASATCGEDGHVLPPLIILDRDEEEPHDNLVVLDSVTQAGCRLSLTNRWPLDQDWLYVDQAGLHARSVNREDPRIAFMALSQVQVELVLECDSDTNVRAKRSIDTSPRLDWLGPYEYGSKQWILTDTILYNSRRSFVNLIVNDINDNYPIFDGKENEPIVVGYPIPELEEFVLPRALAELKATDADVGENAELAYWSPEAALAVARRSGSVHVRDGVSLADGATLTVSATDRNGQNGLTGSIQLLVKLVDSRHIAVVTVRNAFLDEEGSILSNLTAAVGYEVKVLSSAVISDDTDAVSTNARNKREVASAEGASMQLYVYGLIDREPVAVDQLSTDITENLLTAIDIVSTVSLEDHLEGRAIYGNARRDTGLFVATIVLSVLLFILIVAIAVWYFLKWRRDRNYKEFSDASSISSRNEPIEEPQIGDQIRNPRLNIQELRRSERRLQEMLDVPVEDLAAAAAVDPEGVFDTIINMAPPDTTMPIVIQSIDKLKDDANSGDEDEYGERRKRNRKKSVVTFNENVEKIIHVEDIPDDNTSEVEVFKF